MTSVRLGRTLRDAAGAAVLQVEAATLRDVFDQLVATHPGVERRIRDEAGGVRRHVAVFVDGVRVTDQQVPVGPSTQVDVLPAVSGG